jgi:hypothetical protein
MIADSASGVFEFHEARIDIRLSLASYLVQHLQAILNQFEYKEARDHRGQYSDCRDCGETPRIQTKQQYASG